MDESGKTILRLRVELNEALDEIARLRQGLAQCATIAAVIGAAGYGPERVVTAVRAVLDEGDPKWAQMIEGRR